MSQRNWDNDRSGHGHSNADRQQRASQGQHVSGDQSGAWAGGEGDDDSGPSHHARSGSGQSDSFENAGRGANGRGEQGAGAGYKSSGRGEEGQNYGDTGSLRSGGYGRSGASGRSGEDQDRSVGAGDSGRGQSGGYQSGGYQGGGSQGGGYQGGGYQGGGTWQQQQSDSRGYGLNQRPYGDAESGQFDSRNAIAGGSPARRFEYDSQQGRSYSGQGQQYGGRFDSQQDHQSGFGGGYQGASRDGNQGGAQHGAGQEYRGGLRGQHEQSANWDQNSGVQGYAQRDEFSSGGRGGQHESNQYRGGAAGTFGSATTGGSRPQWSGGSGAGSQFNAQSSSGYSSSESTRRGAAPRNYKKSDDRINDDVCERLMSQGIDCGDVEVAVKDGIVTLTGEVSERGDKHRIEQTAADVSGVLDVENQLRLKRKDGASSRSTSSTEAAATDVSSSGQTEKDSSKAGKSGSGTGSGGASAGSSGSTSTSASTVGNGSTTGKDAWQSNSSKK